MTFLSAQHVGFKTARGIILNISRQVLYETYGIGLDISFGGLSVIFLIIVFGNVALFSPRYKVGYSSRSEERQKMKEGLPHEIDPL